MIKTFFYEKKLNINITKISIIGSFNNFEPDKNLLTLNEKIWKIDLDINEGIHKYKYIINDYIRINDPYADYYILDDFGEIWSVITVPYNKNSNTLKGHIELSEYIITNKIWDKFNILQMNKEINLKYDKLVAVGLNLENIAKLHSITIVWYRPDLLIHHIAEEGLYVEEDDLNNAAETWLWIDLNEKDREYPLGIWRISIFLDGEYIIEDAFKLE